MNCKECINRRCLRSSESTACNTCVYKSSNFLDVYNWLSDIKIPQGTTAFDCVEVRFKNGRKGFYRNVNSLPLKEGDVIAVESSPGHDIGNVSLVGELCRIQMSKKGEDPANEEIKKVYRLATQKDIDMWKTAIGREQQTLVRTREICDSLQLSMKLSDVEYQGDNLKATFFYTAEGRVDFRQLIKELAGAFGVRIEMRQIGLRQEAARVGGIGSCGRELCCTTWLTDFRSVNTSAARYQRLSLNPQKLAGQCGKLKCCLNFELDVYVDALKNFPSSDVALVTEKGSANFQKMDVFKGMYWYAYDFEFMNWIGLSVDAVRKIQQINRRGGKVESLEMFVEQTEEKPKNPRQNIGEMKSIEEEELTRFDKKKNKTVRQNTQNATSNDTQNNTPAPSSERPDRREQRGERQDRRPRRQDRPQRREDDAQRRHSAEQNNESIQQPVRQERPIPQMRQDAPKNVNDEAKNNQERRNFRNNRNNNRRGNNNRPYRGGENKEQRPERNQNGGTDNRNDNKNE